MSASSLLSSWFHTPVAPYIFNAPMLGHAGVRLATEVTKAGGFGLLAAGFDFSPASAQLESLARDLATTRTLLNLPPKAPLPIGVGFITSHSTALQFPQTVLPLLVEHRPSLIWLFAPDPKTKPHGAIISALRAASGDGWTPRVFVQVGNVAAAREALEDGADGLVAQGVDAGGHQFRRGASIVTLVPEMRDLLAREFSGRDVVLLAAGGLSDGRGVAGALALGADGVVLGTRFIPSDEATGADHRKQLILNSADGAISTLKSPFHDEVTSNALWSHLYDGRALVGSLGEEYMAGSSVEECKASLEEMSEDEKARATRNWAGTGVGLVRTAGPAGDIVKELREETIRVIQNLGRGYGN